MSSRLAPDVATTLAAADIPASKLGATRRARLAAGEHELYVWILRRFATGKRPTRAQLRQEAERAGTNLEHALGSLAHEDLVHLDATGEIVVAYPFSGRPTAHRVGFASGAEVAAMCALDALGMAPMFGEAIEIDSRDPLTGEDIRVSVAPDGGGTWQPESTVVVSGALVRGDDACCGCCPVLNFFASTENAQAWLAQHEEVRGHVVSMPIAIAAARAVFGDVFDAA